MPVSTTKQRLALCGRVQRGEPAPRLMDLRLEPFVHVDARADRAEVAALVRAATRPTEPKGGA